MKVIQPPYLKPGILNTHSCRAENPMALKIELSTMEQLEVLARAIFGEQRQGAASHPTARTVKSMAGALGGASCCFFGRDFAWGEGAHGRGSTFKLCNDTECCRLNYLGQFIIRYQDAHGHEPIAVQFSHFHTDTRQIRERQVHACV